MELAFEQKQRSCLKRTAHLSLAQEQTQELIIPDAMPDAARTLICYAEPELQSKTSRAGSLLVTGNLRASCLYADEAGGLQLLTTDVPFTLKLESSDLQELTQSVVRCSVRSADSRLINSRKVLLRISVLVQADGYEPWTEEVRALTDAPACLQQKTQTYSNAVPVETAERAFQVSEELNVPEGRAKIVRLADCMLQPVVTEQNLVGSKAVMKGTANLQLTYLDEQNELRTLSLAVPFSQYCQLQGDYEQNEDVETALLVTGVQLEPVDTETGQKLLFGAGILAQCTVIQPQTLTLCEDAYSTRGDFQPQWQEQEYSMRLDAQTLREPIRPSFPAQASAVLDCRVYPDAMALERTADGVYRLVLPDDLLAQVVLHLDKALHLLLLHAGEGNPRHGRDDGAHVIGAYDAARMVAGLFPLAENPRTLLLKLDLLVAEARRPLEVLLHRRVQLLLLGLLDGGIQPRHVRETMLQVDA